MHKSKETTLRDRIESGREKGAPNGTPLSKKFRRRPTLPEGFPPSTIGAGSLHFRVRDGNGCFPAAIATGNQLSIKYARIAAPLKTP